MGHTEWLSEITLRNEQKFRSPEEARSLINQLRNTKHEYPPSPLRDGKKYSPNSVAVKQHGKIDSPHATRAEGGEQRRPFYISAKSLQHHLRARYAAIPPTALAHVRRL